MFRMLNINLSDEFLFLEKQTNKHQGAKNLFRTLTLNRNQEREGTQL